MTAASRSDRSDRDRPYCGSVQFGAHLPLLDFGAPRRRVAGLTAFARTADELGYRAIAANDHLTFARPWLDGVVALASVVAASGDLTLATTAALPVIRGPVALAQAAAALGELSGGRLLLGVAPGSSRADYDLVGLDFADRWSLFDTAIAVLRERLSQPIWVASWGSDAGLRRVARLGDGWLASAYNSGPADVLNGRVRLQRERERLGVDSAELGCTVATMWTKITDRAAERKAALDELAGLLGRSPDVLADRLLVGPPEHCAHLVRAYADAGVELLCLWPVGDAEDQLERFMHEVVPLAQQLPATAARPSPPPAGRSSAAPEAAPGRPSAGPR